VGVSLPEGVQEREDELRSDLKLKGSETIKTQAARLVAHAVSDSLGKAVDKFNPDVTLIVHLGTGAVTLNAKSLFYYARYTKPSGISQRRELCKHCGGVGCKRCKNTGYERTPSVEEQLRRKLAGYTDSERMKFTWLGSEDAESRVYAPGRPFLAEVKNPVKRKIPRSFAARVKGGQISVTSGRVLPSRPVRLPSFRFMTEILATPASKVSKEQLVELRRAFRRTQVRFDRPYDRPVTKTVYSALAKQRGRRLIIEAELDGGLPVKRFVSGELVSPSVSEVLKTEVRCRNFDICGVKEIGGFEFAEIARKQKKN
jgi:tRNA pseudouridine synthase 10